MSCKEMGIEEPVFEDEPSGVGSEPDGTTLLGLKQMLEHALAMGADPNQQVFCIDKDDPDAQNMEIVSIDVAEGSVTIETLINHGG